jgi:hypothetical protein
MIAVKVYEEEVDATAMLHQRHTFEELNVYVSAPCRSSISRSIST